MDRVRLEAALGSKIEPALAAALVGHFLKIREDAATRTLERAVAGKFVETFVQCLQWMATGKYEAKPNVDQSLQKVEGAVALPEGLRICGARTARAIYTMRNKRNIAHIGEVDPNVIDLAFTAGGSAWIMSELVRIATGVSMDEAGKVIELLQMPIDSMVEDIGDVRLVHGDFGVREELLVLLRSYYPDVVQTGRILKSLERWNEGSVKNKVARLGGDQGGVRRPKERLQADEGRLSGCAGRHSRRDEPSLAASTSGGFSPTAVSLG